MTDASLLLRVLSFAADRHRHQRRKGAEGSPYINHAIEVARLVASEGKVEDNEVLAAAVLHDTIEDTVTTPEELEQHFGARVRSLVEEVTDDRSLQKLERKRRQIEAAPSLSPGAKLIRLADKVSNVLDVVRHPPAGWSLARRIAYVTWTERVVDGCRGISPELERRFDDAASSARKILEELDGLDRELHGRGGS